MITSGSMMVYITVNTMIVLIATKLRFLLLLLLVLLLLLLLLLLDDDDGS